MGHLAYGIDRVGLRRIYKNIRAKLLCASQSLVADIECDHAGAHGRRELRRRKSHRSLAEDRDRLVAGELQALQRAPRRSRAA